MLWWRSGKHLENSVETYDSDARLLEGLKHREEKAFLHLYDHHGRSIYRFLVHMTGSLTLAEELTQEVFVAILDSICTGAISQFNPERGALEGYLLGIARNLARQERRRTNRLLSLESVLETQEWNLLFDNLCRDRAWDVPKLLAVRSEMKGLYEAILELPEHYRAVIVLCSLQERSYQQAALLLGCSEGTVASRMNRAKTLLAAKLRQSASGAVNASAS